MALKIKISAVEVNDALSFVLSDNTGVYNAVTNTGGYNAPNPTVAQILTATLSITPPDYTTPIVLTLVQFPLASYVLMANGTTPFTVTAAMLGLTTLPDGIYNISLTVTYAAAPTTSTGQTTAGFVAVIFCCVSKKLAAVPLDDNCSCCDDSQAAKALEVYTDMCIARESMKFGLTNIFTKYLTRLNKLCDPTLCGCSGT